MLKIIITEEVGNVDDASTLLRYIARQIREGFVAGINPTWKLEGELRDYVFDPAVCPSSLGEDDKPITEGETDHKWDDDTNPVTCAECGTEKDEDTAPEKE